MKKRSFTNHWRAFSLIEVNLAILLVSVGVLTLLALFPLGLRENEEGIVDTHEAMFADHVLSGLAANARTITNWTTWAYNFENTVDNGIEPIDGEHSVTAVGAGVKFPDISAGSSRFIRYELTITDADERGVLKRAELKVKSGKYGDFSQKARVYLADFVFMGM